MAPKVPSIIKCSSTALLEHELSTIRASLEVTETEDTWDKITIALQRLNALIIGSVADYPSQLIAACKGFVRPIINSLNSERSRLSGCATDLLTSLVTHLQRTFETLIPLFVPTLLSLASRSNKIFIARAKACLLAIVENCQSPMILPLLRHAISDKSVMLRLTATDLVVACLNCFNPPDLETPNRVDDIEVIIRATARDASADVRKSSRRAFEAYKVLFPSRLDAFVAPLTPTMRKYLDIKSAPANHRKPLLLSSSTSAPTLPSSTHSSDILSRSQPPVQGHGKSASTSSAPFTRVERASKSSKPPSSASTSESAAMPPPPPPKQKSSSGPVRPPPSMRQAVAAAVPAPSRHPLFNRHASRLALLPSSTAVPDMTRSQPISHAGAQRTEKTIITPATSPPDDIAPPAPSSLDVEPAAKARTNSGPRRVPKPEPVPILTAVPPPAAAPSLKQVDNLRDSVKEKEKEKAMFTSSASSTTSAHTTARVFSRPPSDPASSTNNNKTGEEKTEKVKEKEREKVKESRKRPESRAGGEFRPRPASRTDNESHKRTTSKNEEMHVQPALRIEGDAHPRPPSRMERPASRTEGEVHVRPASRAEKRTQAMPESRAEMKSARPPKKPAEQAQPQPQLQEHIRSSTQTIAPAKDGERKKRREEHVSRAASKCSKEERAMREKPSKKRRGEVKDKELKQVESTEAVPVDGASQAGLVVPSGEVPQTPVKTGQPEGQNIWPQPECVLQSSAPTDDQLPLESAQNTSSSSQDSNATGQVDTLETAKAGLAMTENCLPTKEDEVLQVEEETSDTKTPTRLVKPVTGHQTSFGIKPLAIHKASADKALGDFDAEYEEEMAYIAASDIPLPPSPPPNSYATTEFVTPAPLRRAVASSRNQVPATPISKLLVSIQRGFDLDFSMIDEETEGDITLSNVLPHAEAHPHPGEADLETNKGTEDVHGDQDFFIDVRPRKLKSSHRKEKARHRAEERLPFTPRAENRQ